ncbi:MAG: DUF1186 domain-containing protein [Ignavibacteria bacterium]|nr:DUF1186 domain-containing protein [Ignavibacteria bacterium]
MNIYLCKKRPLLKKYDSLILTGYKIVFDPAELYKENGITPEIVKLLETALKKVLQKKKNAEEDVRELIEKYPQVPQFKNYLTTHYSMIGKFDKAFEINQQIVKEHPDYLFGKINLALEYLRNKDFEKIPGILGEAMEIKSLYPEREVFHIEEVMSFYNVSVEYFIETGNIEAAEMRLKIMYDLDKDNTKTAQAAESIALYNIKAGYKRLKANMSKSRKPKFISKKKYKQTDVEPSFINSEIKLLYQFSFQIDFTIIKKLLELPRQSLIEDLTRVVIDSIVRFKYFKKPEWEDYTHSFALHALFMLRELKAEEALETVLDLLRQNEKFLNYWVGDLLTEYMWMIIYELGKNQLDTLRDFILEEGNFTYARVPISEAVCSIGQNFPERRNEVIDWYYTVFNLFIEQKDNDKLIDTTLIGLMVGDVLDLKATELEETIVKLYEAEIVGEEVVGGLDDLLRDLHNKNLKIFKRESDSLEKIYKEFSKQEKYVEKELAKEKVKSAEDENIKEYATLPEIYKNVGRNEKCPCGSGLKFKKCHGKPGI